MSRIGSSAKLNQLSVPGVNSRPSSRPNTPSTYVSSSLNPTKSLPVTSNSVESKIKNQEQAELFESLPIMRSIREFEHELRELSQSISTFREENLPSQVGKLIQMDKNLTTEKLNVRKSQELGAEIEKLRTENNQLSQVSTRFLKELIACRSELRQLPKLPADRQSSRDSRLKEIGVQELLDYSMKLAKFSKAPTTASGQLPHPNNFIWPAEDALRRGMLALASLKSEEIIKAELGEPEQKVVEDDEDVEMEDVEDMDAPKAPKEPGAPSTRGTATAGTATEPAKASHALDLDLFDGDDSEDDSE